MKNYKLLVPIVLIVLFVASVYMLYDTKVSEAQAYSNALAEAREYRAQDIRVDAEKMYMQALEYSPSVDLSVEIGEFYRDTKQVKAAIKWGQSIAKQYPEDAKVYEFLMPVYEAKKDYIACYELAETMRKRGVVSPAVNEILSKIEYYYYFDGDYDGAGIYSGGYAPVLTDTSWGYVAQQGKQVIDPMFSYAGPFIEGLAPVVDQEGNAYFIDTQGNKKHVVLGVDNVEKVGLIEREMFSLYDGKTWSFYNTDHEYIFGGYEDVSSIGNGVAAVLKDGKWSLVDRTGTDLTGKTFAEVVMDEKLVVYRNERLFVSDGKAYQLINVSGSVISDLSFEDARVFNDGTYAAVKIDGKWGFIDKNGTIIIEPKYEDARSYSNGMAAVKQNGQWGFINMDGEMVIAPQFKDAKDFNSNGCVFVQTGDEWELLRLYKSNY